MSTVGGFKQIAPAVLERLIQDPSLAFPFIYHEDTNTEEDLYIIPKEDDIDEMDIDKTWHAIHFLLTGQAKGGELPLANVIMGGQELDIVIGYENVRFLTASEVKEVAQALAEISPEVLIARFNPEKMNQLEIYQTPWEANKKVDREKGHLNDEEYILEWYNKLVEYYTDAAQRGNGMLLYLT